MSTVRRRVAGGPGIGLRWRALAGLAAGGLVVAGCSAAPDDPDRGVAAPTSTALAAAPTTDEAPPDPAVQLRVGVVAPGAADDRAWTQSMLDSLDRLAHDADVEVATGVEDADDADAALRGFAEREFDLVIAHGVQYGRSLQDVAADFPDVAFAGHPSSASGPNVFAYSAAAEQGGYVNGLVAASLTTSKSLGVVAPVPVGDAQAYIAGFERGAAAAATGAAVDVIYIDSFRDVRLASEAAEALVGDGVDVLTGSGQMAAGALGVAVDANVPWFGSQSDQRDLGPTTVVASQVYRWEVVIEPMLERVAAGSTGGDAFVATLGNGGLDIVFNDDFDLDPAVRARADAAIAGIADGTIVVGPSD